MLDLLFSLCTPLDIRWQIVVEPRLRVLQTSSAYARIQLRFGTFGCPIPTYRDAPDGA